MKNGSDLSNKIAPFRWKAIGIAFYFFYFLSTVLPCQAQQKKIVKQNLAWFRYANRLLISDRFELQTEIDERRFIYPSAQHQLLFRTVAVYKMKEGWDTGVGFTYFLQSPHDPRSASRLVIPELRPHQELNYRQPLNDRWKWQQRFRLEERFFRHTADGKLTDGYDFNFRFRYKADLFYTLLKNKQEKELLLLTLSEEMMLNAGKNIVFNVFDQNRVYGGVRVITGQATALEGGYLFWFQQRQSGEDFYHRDIFRFTVYHKLSLKKKDP